MWLFALYGFLALTTVAVLASLGVLAVGLRRLGIAILILLPMWVIASFGIAYGVHRIAYALESHDPFCVSCHLHENEFKRFRDEASSVALEAWNDPFEVLSEAFQASSRAFEASNASVEASNALVQAWNGSVEAQAPRALGGPRRLKTNFHKVDSSLGEGCRGRAGLTAC